MEISSKGLRNMTTYASIGGENAWYSPSLTSNPYTSDLSGNGYNLTYQGGGSNFADDPVPDSETIGKVFAFDGVDDWMSVSPSAVPQALLSFSCWFITGSNDASLNLFGNINSSTSQGLYALNLNTDLSEQVSAGKCWFYFRHPTNSNLRGGIDTDLGYNDGTWHHITLTVDKANSSVNIYLDGTLATTTYLGTATGTSVITWSQDFGIALLRTSTGGFYYFNGYMDDIRFFDRKLNQSEVSSLYSMRDVSLPTRPDRLLLGVG